jgi:PPOX class probable F420-dependent enzyme
MREMSQAERRAFLTEGTRTGKLATVRADGSPHVVPIWFALDDDALVFTVDAASVKAKALRRDPRVSVCVDEELPPYAFVLVEGTAVILDDEAAKLRWRPASAAATWAPTVPRSSAAATPSPPSCWSASRRPTWWPAPGSPTDRRPGFAQPSPRTRRAARSATLVGRRWTPGGQVWPSVARNAVASSISVVTRSKVS